MSAPAATRPLVLLATALVAALLPATGAQGTEVTPGGQAAPTAASSIGQDTGEAGDQQGFDNRADLDQVDPVDPDVVTLLDQTTWLNVDETFRATLSPGQLPDDATLTVNVRRPLTTRNELHEVFFGQLPAQQIAAPVQQPVAEVPRDDAGNLEVVFDVTRPEFDPVNGGVHPVEIAVQAPDGELLAHLVTYLLLAPTAEFPDTLPVGVVVEMGASPVQQPDGEVKIAEDDLAHLLSRVDLLDRLGGSSRVSAAPVPETIDGLLREDGVDPGLADRFRAGLRPHEVLARPYVNLDLDQWAATPELIPQAPPEFHNGAEVIRNIIGMEPTPNVWLTGSSVSSAGAATWLDLTEANAVTNAVLRGEAVSSIDSPPESVAPLVQIPEGPVAYISDQGLEDRLLGAEDAQSRYRAVAELAMLWFEQPGDPRPVAVRLPAEAALHPEHVATALEEAEATGVVDVLPVTELFSRYGPDDERVPAGIELAPNEAGDSLSGMPAQLTEGRYTLDAIADTVDADSTTLASFERALLIAPGAEVSPRERRAYLDAVDGAGDELSDSIDIPDTFRITLTDRNADIPLTITNDLDSEVELNVDLSSNQLDFRDGDRMEVTVPPGTHRFDIPVRTRTSGSFRLHIAVTSPDGQLTFDEATFDIRSTAISGFGLILSVGAGAFLILWWVRHWRRTRREQQEDPTPEG